MQLSRIFLILIALVSLSSCAKYNDPDEKLIIPPYADYVPTQK